MELARQPEPFEIPTGPALCLSAADDWAKARRVVERQAERIRAPRAGNVEISAFLKRFIRDGEVEPDRRAVSTFRAAAELGELYEAHGFDALAHALLAEAALDSGLTPSEASARSIAVWLTADDKGRGRGMSEARYQSTADLLDAWRDDVLSGKPPTLYPVGTGELARIEIGPGLVTLIGGAPGAGKTALTMQWVLDALSARRA